LGISEILWPLFIIRCVI